ncbi:single-stranded DNA-binding protein [Bifidobacterium moukalabense]|uniref:Single-strand binding protein n=1 Tax=Bifidobacterium moukalabense DSM 27321 TaxID=1435051 RepID=W4N966_9BIFI|nr:single-stranded DNA-binding protein [Bifidobacterium moukalabense]ETY71026.1 single-strand binding protein [Bifidobacterium moukalabense DSM 27321]
MAQQQGLLTITGYVGANPVPFNREGMPHASSFRLASTRHYFDNRTQQWRDLPTTWITVKAYRTLSENICQSFKKGEPVIVTGVLATETWNGENGEPRSRTVLEASNAGHDLNYGATALRRFAKPNAANAEATARNSVAPSNAGAPIGADPYANPQSTAGAMAPPVELLPHDEPEPQSVQAGASSTQCASSAQCDSSAQGGSGWTDDVVRPDEYAKAAESVNEEEFSGQEF